MYTVLILSRGAIDSYHEYEPIMAINEKSDGIGVCTWYESANTIDTAVPELSGLIHRHKQWRAIVIQTELPGKEDKYAVLNNNPYDYVDDETTNREYPFLSKELVDGKETEKIIPSKFPMVLISQLLGGIPVQSPDFCSQTVIENRPRLGAEDETKTPVLEPATERQVIIQKQSSSELRRYKKLCEEWSQQFASAGSAPSEIILIRRRQISFIEVENQIQTGWKGFAETQSSMFWNRMGYPNLCRFLTFDVDMRGTLTETGDMFRFWNAVLLLAGNRIGASILQPYRLYRMDIQYNHDKLRESVQEAVNRLNYAQYRIEQVSTQQQNMIRAEGDEFQEPPDISVPVKLELHSAISKGNIPLPDQYSALTEGKDIDLADWAAYTAKASKAWSDEQTVMKRLLSKSAVKMRKASELDETQVTPLTEYQKEDLMDLLDEYYAKILEEQESLPVLRKKYITEELQEADEEVRRHIDRRFGMNRLGIILAVLLLSIGLAIGCAFHHLQSPWYIPAAYLCGAVIVCLCGIAVSLTTKKHKLNRETREYYAAYAQAQTRLLEGGNRLALFFSHVGTTMRGKSCLFALDSLEKKQQEMIDATNRKVKTLFRLQDLLSRWCDALQLKVNFDDHNAMEEMIDGRYAIDFELLSTLTVSRDWRVRINKTGATVKGAYDFVDCLLIEREGIYDE